MRNIATAGLIGLCCVWFSGSAPAAAQHAKAPAGKVADAAILKRGKTLFMRCRSCHTLKAGEPSRLGPNLHGVFGAKAGVKAGYRYSPAMANSGIVWTDATVGDFIAKPRGAVQGTKMVFAGLPKAADRAALIAYLKAETK